LHFSFSTGSWIPDLVIQCEPATYDKYPREKTIYNNATLRAFNMLVETSHQKIPPTNMLGNSKDVLSFGTDGNGHVSRNIRLSLLSAELVEPYVAIVAVNDLALSDDLIPLVERNCKTASKQVMIPKNVDQVTVEWSVGGALEIDETVLWVTESVPQGILDCRTQPSRADIEAAFKQVIPDGPIAGSGLFAAGGPIPHPDVSNTNIEPCLGPVFRAVVDVSLLKVGDRLTVVASSIVDQSWTSRPTSNVKPDLPPQAHVVNARTNPDWHYESAGKHVKGRLDWFSLPIDIVVGDYDNNVGQNQAGREITTIEVSNRFGQTTGPGGASPFVPQESSFTKNHMSFMLAVLVGVCLVLILLMVAKRNDGAYTMHTNIDDEEDSWDHKPYSDNEQQGDVEMKLYDDEPLSDSTTALEP
jgi:hypothetical protein